jgi:hypothetical protein
MAPSDNLNMPHWHFHLQQYTLHHVDRIPYLGRRSLTDPDPRLPPSVPQLPPPLPFHVGPGSSASSSPLTNSPSSPPNRARAYAHRGTVINVAHPYTPAATNAVSPTGPSLVVFGAERAPLIPNLHYRPQSAGTALPAFRAPPPPPPPLLTLPQRPSAPYPLNHQALNHAGPSVHPYRRSIGTSYSELSFDAGYWSSAQLDTLSSPSYPAPSNFHTTSSQPPLRASASSQDLSSVVNWGTPSPTPPALPPHPTSLHPASSAGDRPPVPPKNFSPAAQLNNDRVSLPAHLRPKSAPLLPVPPLPPLPTPVPPLPKEPGLFFDHSSIAFPSSHPASPFRESLSSLSPPEPRSALSSLTRNTPPAVRPE